MPPLPLAAPLFALGIVAPVADAGVPAFVRQTGLACNQCHVSWTHAADFTFTGMKFRLNGYRSPRVSEAIESGTEGAINRTDLLRTFARMLSVRARSTVAWQRKNASNPMLPEPEASPVASNFIGPFDLYVTGPIGEHGGVWSDFCWYGGSDAGLFASTETTCARPEGYLGLSQLAAQVTTNVNGDIWGFGASLLEAGRAHGFMGMTPATAPNHQLYNPGVGGESPYTSLGVHALLADLVALKVGLEPGDGNLDFERFNYTADVAIFPLHSDAGWLLLEWIYRAGNDMTPGLAGVPGAAALSKGGAGYRVGDGDAVRMLYSIGYGFGGRGPHGFVGTVNLAVENEDYKDGASGLADGWRQSALLLPAHVRCRSLPLQVSKLGLRRRERGHAPDPTRSRLCGEGGVLAEPKCRPVRRRGVPPVRQVGSELTGRSLLERERPIPVVVAGVRCRVSGVRCNEAPDRGSNDFGF